jgi:hypothetical protein
MSAQQHIVHQAKNHHASKHHTRPVHRDERDGYSWWEERKQRADDQETGCDNVAGKAELAESPWPHADVFALDTLADHKEDGEEVGEEEPSDGERDDSVEGGRGANIDQADDGGDGGAKEDGAEREGRFADLIEK